jgi:hypothetical protein
MSGVRGITGSSIGAVAAAAIFVVVAGCGTTRISDTMRTGTEQLLLSNAIDRTINEMNFTTLSGKDVFLDTQYMRGCVDEGYIISSLRQHLLASGAVLKRDRDDATYIVEARAGAVGTNRHDVLLGVPAINLPSTGMPGVPSMVPELPFAKSTQQKGVTKLAVFVYNQDTGTPTWQSGAITVAATSRDTWVFGTGPFQRGTIYQGTGFAGSRVLLPFSRDKQPPPNLMPAIPVTAQATFQEKSYVASTPRARLGSNVDAATSTPPSKPAKPESMFTPLSLPAAQSAVVTVGGTSTTYSGGQPAAAGQPANTSVHSGGNSAGAVLMGATPWIRDKVLDR